MRSFGALVGLAVGVGVCAPVSAAVIIRDRSFFANKQHTFLDFETKGDGSPVDLPFLGAQLFPPDEYADKGVLFHGGVAWGNVRLPSFGGTLNPEGGVGDALDAVGSWPTAIGSTDTTWTLEFIHPTHSFGLGVIRNGFHGDDPTRFPRAEVYDALGGLIGVLELTGDLAGR